MLEQQQYLWQFRQFETVFFVKNKMDIFKKQVLKDLLNLAEFEK